MTKWLESMVSCSLLVLALLPFLSIETIFTCLGPLMSLRTMGQTILVVNSATVAKDLLEKRGLTWSDRPVFPLFDM